MLSDYLRHNKTLTLWRSMFQTYWIKSRKKNKLLKYLKLQYYNIGSDIREAFANGLCKDFLKHKLLKFFLSFAIDEKVVERATIMPIRVAVCIHVEDIDAAIETNNSMSEKYFTHASPTLFNTRTPRSQLQVVSF
ncbi:6401_t:CDS:2 [Dentiscutata erythropus]|uniref:6401_t:CDS:1 n=1 Tax=Dentiscutata erythropus TaxID=1348616 RepID=A0A9N9C7N9_9GLOM|nr:6401_t:CDS:2 [Dentiscutata erythropus]